MNDIDLVNADLHDEDDGIVSVEGVVTAVEAAATVVEETPVPVVTTVTTLTKPKSGAGRKVDTTGKTALGAARLLYAANPSLGTKELRNLFVQELGPKFNTSEQVAQTYVSLVRKPKGKKSATA